MRLSGAKIEGVFRQCGAALALQVDRTAGGMQVDAGFLIGFLFVGGLAGGEDRQAVLDGEAVVALGDEVGVVPGGDGEMFAGGEDVVFRCQQGDAGRGAQVQLRLAPGGDGAAEGAQCPGGVVAVFEST